MATRLLINEPPLMFQPTLAVLIGDRPAIFLQQLHYWLDNKNAIKHEFGGHYWVRNSVSRWLENFPFWSKNTLIRIITKLEDLEVLVSETSTGNKTDRTKMYRIDYDVLDELFELAQQEDVPETKNANTQNGYEPIPKTVTSHLPKVGKCLIDYKETNSQTRADSPLGGKDKENSPSEIGEKQKPKVEDLVKNAKSKIAKKKIKVAKPPTSISQLWQQTLEKVDGIKPKNLTGEDRGKLNHVVKNYPDDWAEMVKLVLNDWSSYTTEVVIAKNLSQVPETPHTGFFCKFCDVAYHSIEKARQEALNAQFKDVEKPDTKQETQQPTNQDDEDWKSSSDLHFPW